jgi:hypothetical protein
VILPAEVECGQIQIHPALQAAGNSNLKGDQIKYKRITHDDLRPDRLGKLP